MDGLFLNGRKNPTPLFIDKMSVLIIKSQESLKNHFLSVPHGFLNQQQAPPARLLR